MASTFNLPASRAGAGSVVITQTAAETFAIPGVGFVEEGASGGGGGGVVGGGSGIYIGGLLGLMFRPV